MKKNNAIPFVIAFSVIVFMGSFISCTKVGKGYLSPYMAYTSSEFSFVAGRTAQSNTINVDGSTTPIHVKWLHFYDSTGKNVDDFFSKKYPVSVWKQPVNPKTDTSFKLITDKLGKENLEPLVVNEESGVITSNAGSVNLPVGRYTMDLQVSNAEGTEVLKNALNINIMYGAAVEVSQTDVIAVGKALANHANQTYIFRGDNNPFIRYTITKLADTPNSLVLKFTDKNGVPFNPKTGEIFARPSTGINPNPPTLQGLKDFAPGTYETTDIAMSARYPTLPFPTSPLVNGYLLYYFVKASIVTVDNTSSYSGNSPGNYYQGVSDPHYLGTFPQGMYDYTVRVPVRVYLPGSYEVNFTLLGVTHR